MSSDKKKVRHGKGPYLFLPVFISKNSRRIGLFVIASELCENLVKADTY